MPTSINIVIMKKKLITSDIAKEMDQARFTRRRRATLEMLLWFSYSIKSIIEKKKKMALS